MAIIPLMIKIAPTIGMIDRPDPRKVHVVPIPRVGGVGIVLGALIPVLLFVPVDQTLLSFIFGAVILLAFGVWDDVAELGHYVKFIGQFCAVALVVYWGDVYVTQFPFMGLEPIPDAIGKPFTVLAMVGVINAINHSDGLDGLAGGESLLSLGCLAYLSYIAGGLTNAMIACAAIGGVFGFLRYNSHPAGVFMGDGGSQYLGFALAFLTVELTQTVNSALSPALPLLILGLPVIDILAVLAQRIYLGMHWFRASKNHIHHRVMELGFGHYGAVVIIYSIQAFFVISAVFLAYERDSLIVGLYLTICAAVFAGIITLERSGWRPKRFSLPVRFSRWVEQGTLRGTFSAASTRLLWIVMPVYLVFANTFIENIPMDFGVIAFGLFVVFLVSLLMKKAPTAMLNRGAVYISVAFLVYLMHAHPAVSTATIELAEKIFFMVLALLLAVAIRYARQDNFRLTPMDYLVLLVLLLVGVINGAEDNPLVFLVIKLVILFYAAEWIIHRATRVWNGLAVATLMTLIIISIRGLL